ncbi:assimilatory sulfite reductase (NADPH) hemoprotein subunit [Paenibacillus alginolyticus]|uniref:Sulfite reductase [NADPH] hemoprotein beta-component n=1 Tax=Paenibacillus alginolyticus TaxID=59839 RepID=A0ABT4GGI7_9BACL|nr:MULTISPECIES: assimilatory sulfite reductase (NADPH) hemoprotein subunit [Paenibacillus]MCY9668400.1 assimilatory sulfite reductase (NADPH) hemoprotein subunit [Paenibacillus alginolyticus]MCY9695310.1 assimilatory sulfite reductase (NADPH) hemoprotein subunit [Paenibacillus alginolyticus]MEC0144798.1 assimilatory sulfite reductase (NADPH) hemoprotein subunit [Paenibacillus alginolyticus]NRF92453.1 assimilatory sulfite reductase (NADPH) hemoprotein subunit [Paenibacillus frigoriresistens]
MSENNLLSKNSAPHSEVEHIKMRTNYLRGSLEETLIDAITGSIPEDDNRLMKFHGSYMQDDRDLRNERQKQKLEPAYQFMLRVRAAGGIVTPEQWLMMDQVAQKYANGTIRLTTRQSFQLHGVLKWNLKKTIREVNDSLLSTLAACGDVNRNVMCNPNPYQSDVHAEVYEWASRVSNHLDPQTKAYHEIWLDGEKVVDSQDGVEQEPIYGKVYLPRKFKIGIAVPPSNDVDVFSQDLGFIAIVEDGRLKGFNVSVGGGMGMTHGDPLTYPQVAQVIGFITPDQMIDLAEKTVTIQRDYGDRSVRKHARFKYTIDDRGIDWFVDELTARLGWKLEAARPYHFDHNGDRYGWVKGSNGKWHFNLFIQNGRVKDEDNYLLMTGLREIAKVHNGDFRLTANQNLVIGNVSTQKKKKIEELIKEYGLTDGLQYSALRRSSMACVSLPTCGMAMAEAERYLPDLMDKIEPMLEEAGLSDKEIVIRMTGCPNGCARPMLAEIAFIGKAPGKYNMYLGGGHSGNRLNKLYKENIGEVEILESLRPIINQYAKERQENEHFGDFVIRAGYVKEVRSGQDFHS